LRDQIEILASLQNVDREIKEKNTLKRDLSAQIQGKEDEIQAKKSEFALLQAEWAERDKERREKEQVLQEDSSKTTEKRMRMNRLKNIKELQAVQREIDQIKENNKQREEELITILEDLEARSALVREKEEELKKLEEEWNGKKGEIETEVARLEQALVGASTGRQAIAVQLDGDLIQRYELIFSRRGGMAVVTVSGGICQGCFMNIPPQLWNEIIKSETLNLCPSCHRILYHNPNVPNDKQL
jgi:predicted  nucleic acid-binding Zn-ribbon protein